MGRLGRLSSPRRTSHSRGYVWLCRQCKPPYDFKQTCAVSQEACETDPALLPRQILEENRQERCAMLREVRFHPCLCFGLYLTSCTKCISCQKVTTNPLREALKRKKKTTDYYNFFLGGGNFPKGWKDTGIFFKSQGKNNPV